MLSVSESETIMSEARIEQTPDARRLQIKSWKCQECGSMHSRSQDAERHWLDKHHGEVKESARRG
jgi:hypothetical protein